MATTTNYSWSTPDDTALVKDGAAAIRSLGTAIDTTVFNNAGAAIAKTIVDAKGDIIAATAADTVARLAVGANNTVLTADSSTATGLKWAAAAGGGKVLQVVSSTITTETQITTTSLADTGITATITPTSASSKILVLISQLCQADGNTNEIAIGAKLLRGATTILDYGDYGFQIEYDQGATFFTSAVPGSISYYDSPATTSATTYKLQAKLSASGSRQASFQYDVSPSTITVLEIGA